MTHAQLNDDLRSSLLNIDIDLKEEIGQGGMGVVYRALQRGVKREVAVKVVQPSLFANKQVSQAEVRARFLREAELTARLTGPNTVRLFLYGVTRAGACYMVMEYLHGKDLAGHLEQRKHLLSTQEILDITRDILRGLSEAHSRGIVHRDLKPQNVYLVSDSHGARVSKLMDFGIARASEVEALTQEGALLGTYQYMAPEQYRGEYVTAQSDLYSVGLMLLEMMTGPLPPRPHAIAHPTFLRSRLATTTRGHLFEALLLRLLDPIATQRPTSADAVLSELNATEQQLNQSVAPWSALRWKLAVATKDVMRKARELRHRFAGNAAAKGGKSRPVSGVRTAYRSTWTDPVRSMRIALAATPSATVELCQMFFVGFTRKSALIARLFAALPIFLFYQLNASRSGARSRWDLIEGILPLFPRAAQSDTARVVLVLMVAAAVFYSAWRYNRNSAFVWRLEHCFAVVIAGCLIARVVSVYTGWSQHAMHLPWRPVRLESTLDEFVALSGSAFYEQLLLRGVPMLIAREATKQAAAAQPPQQLLRHALIALGIVTIWRMLLADHIVFAATMYGMAEDLGFLLLFATLGIAAAAYCHLSFLATIYLGAAG